MALNTQNISSDSSEDNKQTQLATGSATAKTDVLAKLATQIETADGKVDKDTILEAEKVIAQERAKMETDTEEAQQKFPILKETPVNANTVLDGFKRVQETSRVNLDGLGRKREWLDKRIEARHKRIGALNGLQFRLRSMLSPKALAGEVKTKAVRAGANLARPFDALKEKVEGLDLAIETKYQETVHSLFGWAQKGEIKKAAHHQGETQKMFDFLKTEVVDIADRMLERTIKDEAAKRVANGEDELSKRSQDYIKWAKQRKKIAESMTTSPESMYFALTRESLSYTYGTSPNEAIAHDGNINKELLPQEERDAEFSRTLYMGSLNTSLLGRKHRVFMDRYIADSKILLASHANLFRHNMEAIQYGNDGFARKWLENHHVVLRPLSSTVEVVAKDNGARRTLSYTLDPEQGLLFEGTPNIFQAITKQVEADPLPSDSKEEVTDEDTNIEEATETGATSDSPTPTSASKETSTYADGYEAVTDQVGIEHLDTAQVLKAIDTALFNNSPASTMFTAGFADAATGEVYLRNTSSGAMRKGLKLVKRMNGSNVELALVDEADPQKKPIDLLTYLVHSDKSIPSYTTKNDLSNYLDSFVVEEPGKASLGDLAERMKKDMKDVTPVSDLRFVKREDEDVSSYEAGVMTHFMEIETDDGVRRIPVHFSRGMDGEMRVHPVPMKVSDEQCEVDLGLTKDTMKAFIKELDTYTFTE